MARSSPIWKERCGFGDLKRKRAGHKKTGRKQKGQGQVEGRKVKQERDGLRGKDTKGDESRRGKKEAKSGVERDRQEKGHREAATEGPRDSLPKKIQRR